jgi:hypothetical protein
MWYYHHARIAKPRRSNPAGRFLYHERGRAETRRDPERTNTAVLPRRYRRSPKEKSEKERKERNRKRTRKRTPLPLASPVLKSKSKRKIKKEKASPLMAGKKQEKKENNTLSTKGDR